jgi:hypothetical protein
MNEILSYVEAHSAQIIIIWQALFVALAGIAELFGLTKVSKIFGTFAVTDLGRILRYARVFLDMMLTVKVTRDKINGGIVFLVILSSGCSLEAARQTRINSQVKSGIYSAQTRPERECKVLDSVHVYTAYGAELSLGVGTAAGVLAAADTSADVSNAAIGTGIGAAVVAAGLGAWSASSGKVWAEQCSQ